MYIPKNTFGIAMQVKKYLARIKYTGAFTPDLKTLSKLQFAHLLSVPFENLDIHNKIKINLSNLFDKIVTRNRGGFCYELNGLFYELLRQLGFTVKMVSARVYDGKKNYSPEFDHMALMVTFKKDKYLVDVGFGEFSLSPIKIEFGSETNDATGVFKIEKFDDSYIAVEKKNVIGKFIPEYVFSEKERKLNEFYDRCNYHQTNSASHFMKKRICSLPTISGRITLTGNILKITNHGKAKVKQLKTEDQVQKVLWDFFHIKL